jgi:hypothetical protein
VLVCLDTLATTAAFKLRNSLVQMHAHSVVYAYSASAAVCHNTVVLTAAKLSTILSKTRRTTRPPALRTAMVAVCAVHLVPALVTLAMLVPTVYVRFHVKTTVMAVVSAIVVAASASQVSLVPLAKLLPLAQKAALVRVNAYTASASVMPTTLVRLVTRPLLVQVAVVWASVSVQTSVLANQVSLVLAVSTSLHVQRTVPLPSMVLALLPSKVCAVHATVHLWAQIAPNVSMCALRTAQVAVSACTANATVMLATTVRHARRVHLVLLCLPLLHRPRATTSKSLTTLLPRLVSVPRNLSAQRAKIWLPRLASVLNPKAWSVPTALVAAPATVCAAMASASVIQVSKDLTVLLLLSARTHVLAKVSASTANASVIHTLAVLIAPTRFLASVHSQALG